MKKNAFSYHLCKYFQKKSSITVCNKDENNAAKRKLTTVYQHHPCVVPTCGYVGEFRLHKSHYLNHLKIDEEGNVLPMDHEDVKERSRKKKEHQQYFLDNSLSMKNLPKLPAPDKDP